MEENKGGKVLNLSGYFSVSFEGHKNGDKGLKGVTEVIFEEGANVNLNDVRRIPKNIDFSKLGDVGLRKAHLDKYDVVKFSKDAKVNLSYIERGPRVLDVSMCRECILAGSTLDGTEKIIMRDRKQLEETLYNIHYGLDRIEFREDTGNKNIKSNNTGPDNDTPLFIAQMRSERSLG